MSNCTVNGPNFYWTQVSWGPIYVSRCLRDAIVYQFQSSFGGFSAVFGGFPSYFGRFSGGPQNKTKVVGNFL